MIDFAGRLAPTESTTQYTWILSLDRWVGNIAPSPNNELLCSDLYHHGARRTWLTEPSRRKPYYWDGIPITSRSCLGFVHIYNRSRVSPWLAARWVKRAEAPGRKLESHGES